MAIDSEGRFPYRQCGSVGRVWKPGALSPLPSRNNEIVTEVRSGPLERRVKMAPWIGSGHVHRRLFT